MNEYPKQTNDGGGLIDIKLEPFGWQFCYIYNTSELNLKLTVKSWWQLISQSIGLLSVVSVVRTNWQLFPLCIFFYIFGRRSSQLLACSPHFVQRERGCHSFQFSDEKHPTFPFKVETEVSLLQNICQPHSSNYPVSFFPHFFLIVKVLKKSQGLTKLKNSKYLRVPCNSWG
jgi:hypothetical protein